MMYRKLDKNGDMQFGHGGNDYLKNTPACVAQAIATRLRLKLGEWILDNEEGTVYPSQVSGKYTKEMCDFFIRKRVLATEGVLEIEEYESSFDGEKRKLQIYMRVSTLYGEVTIKEVLNGR